MKETRSVARAHHHVPEFYLAGFTAGGSGDSRLWVHDKVDARRWPSTPNGSGKQRDFYRVDVEGVPVDAVERVFAELESKAAPLLKVIADHGVVPTGEVLESLLNYVALQATRGPKVRQLHQRHEEQSLKRDAARALDEPGIVEDALDSLRAEGKDVPDSINRESMRAWLEAESYTIDVPRELSIQVAAEAATGLLSALRLRTWSLIQVAGDAELVTSDSPVALVPGPDHSGVFGFSTANTLVIFPLNRGLALFGVFGGEARQMLVDSSAVAWMNAMTWWHAHRFVYSASEKIHIGQTMAGAK